MTHGLPGEVCSAQPLNSSSFASAAPCWTLTDQSHFKKSGTKRNSLSIFKYREDTLFTWGEHSIRYTDESLCCTPDTNLTSCVNYTKKKLQKKMPAFIPIITHHMSGLPSLGNIKQLRPEGITSFYNNHWAVWKSDWLVTIKGSRWSHRSFHDRFRCAVKHTHTRRMSHDFQTHRVTWTNLTSDQAAIFREPDFVGHKNDLWLLDPFYLSPQL